MPRVGGRHFSYTPAGMRAAERAKEKLQHGQSHEPVPKHAMRRKRAHKQLRKQFGSTNPLFKGLKVGPGLHKRIAKVRKRVEKGGRQAPTLRLQQLEAAQDEVQRRRKTFTPGSRFSKKKQEFVGGFRRHGTGGARMTKPRTRPFGGPDDGRPIVPGKRPMKHPTQTKKPRKTLRY